MASSGILLSSNPSMFLPGRLPVRLLVLLPVLVSCGLAGCAFLSTLLGI